MSYDPEPDSHVKDRVKVVLNVSNQATKKELDHATCVDTSYSATKKYFSASRGEVDKLDIDKLVNVLTSLNNIKTKVDDLDFGKLNTVPVDLKILNDVADNEVVKNTKFNKPKILVNNSEKKIPDGATLIHINQYNTDKQNLEKKFGDVDKKILDTSGLVTLTVLNTKLGEVDNKISDTNGLVTTPVLNTKTGEVENKIPDHAKYITTPEFNKITAEDFVAN